MSSLFNYTRSEFVWKIYTLYIIVAYLTASRDYELHAETSSTTLAMLLYHLPFKLCVSFSYKYVTRGNKEKSENNKII